MFWPSRLTRNSLRLLIMLLLLLLLMCVGPVLLRHAYVVHDLMSIVGSSLHLQAQMTCRARLGRKWLVGWHTLYLWM